MVSLSASYTKHFDMWFFSQELLCKNKKESCSHLAPFMNFERVLPPLIKCRGKNFGQPFGIAMYFEKSHLCNVKGKSTAFRRAMHFEMWLDHSTSLDFYLKVYKPVASFFDIASLNWKNETLFFYKCDRYHTCNMYKVSQKFFLNFSKGSL